MDESMFEMMEMMRRSVPRPQVTISIDPEGPSIQTMLTPERVGMAYRGHITAGYSFSMAVVGAVSILSTAILGCDKTLSDMVIKFLQDLIVVSDGRDSPESSLTPDEEISMFKADLRKMELLIHFFRGEVNSAEDINNFTSLTPEEETERQRAIDAGKERTQRKYDEAVAMFFAGESDRTYSDLGTPQEPVENSSGEDQILDELFGGKLEDIIKRLDKSGDDPEA